MAGNTNYRTGIVITGDPSGGVKAVKLTKEQLEQLNKTTDKARDKSKKYRNETKKSGKSLKDYAGALGMVSTAAGTVSSLLGGISLAIITHETLDAAKASNIYSSALDVNIQTLTGLQYATKGVFEDQEKIGDILKDTSEKIADAYANGGGEAVEALERLNLQASNLVKESPDKQLLAIAGSLDEVGTRAEKIQILESLASDASLLLPLLDNDAAKLNALTAEAVIVGAAISELDSAKLMAVNEELARAGGIAKGAGNQITLALAPAIYGVTKLLNDNIIKFGGMGNIATEAVDLTVTSMGYVLDAGKEVVKVVQLIEIGYLHAGKAGVDAFVATGESGVEVVNAVLQPFRDTIAAIIEGWGYLIDAAAEFSGDESMKKAAEFMADFSTAVSTSTLEMKDFTALQGVLADQIDNSNANLLALIESGAPSDALKQAVEEQRKALEEHAQAAVDAKGANDDLDESTETLTETEKKAKEERQKLLDTLYPVKAATRDYTADLNNLFIISNEQNWTTIQLAEAVNLLAGEYEDLTGVQKKSAEEADYVAQIYKDTASSIRSSFSGAFRDILDGQDTLVDRLEDTFKDMLADMATMAIARPIMIPMVQSIGGFMGVSDKDINATVKELGGTEGVSDEMLAVGEVIGAGITGYMVGGAAAQMFDVANPGMAQNLTAMGAMIGGPMGAAAGFALGAMMSGSWKTTGYGVNLSVADGGISGQSYKTQTRDGGLLGSDSTRVKYRELDDELYRYLQDTFDSITQEFADVADAFSVSADEVIREFESSAKVSLKGLSSEEATAAIDAYIADTADQLALELMPALNMFRESGERLHETYTRLASLLEEVDTVSQSTERSIRLLQAANQVEAWGVEADIATSEITSLFSTLADTTDISERIALEDDITEQIKNRYEFEMQMLSSVQQSVSAVLTQAQNLSDAVSGDIARISGTDTNRTPAQIAAELAGLNNPAAPTNNALLGAWGRSGDLLGQVPSLVSSIGFNYVQQQYAQNTIKDLEEQRLADLAAIERGQPSSVRLEREAALYEQYGESAAYLGGPADPSLNEFNQQSESEMVNAVFDRLIADQQTNLQDLQSSLANDKQQYTGVIEGIAIAEDDGTAALTDFVTGMGDYSDVMADQVDLLSELRDDTLAYYEAQKKLDNAMRSASSSIEDTLDKLHLNALNPLERFDELKARFTTLADSADTATGYDLVNISEEMQALVSPLLSEAATLFASGAGYQDIFALITSELGDASQRLLTEAPDDYEETSIELLGDIDEALNSITGGLTTAEQAIVGAINASRNRTVQSLSEINAIISDERDLLYRAFGDEAVPQPEQDTLPVTYASPQLQPQVDTQQGSTNAANAPVINPAPVYVTVVTPDGEKIKEEMYDERDHRRRRGEYLIDTGKGGW